MVKQKLRERYIDKQALIRLLTNLFGAGTFEVEVRGTFQSHEERLGVEFGLIHLFLRMKDGF
jgi:hypothetical protein